jgi:acetyl-CoA carboxylase carboxyl transferase subunit beta
MADVVAPPRAVSAEWFRCPNCSSFVYHKRLKRNLGVCPECNHHFRLRISERLSQLLDADSMEDKGADLEAVDALAFADSKPYPDRIKDAQRKAGRKNDALFVTGTIDGLPIVVAAVDFNFIGGSMSGAVGEAITRAAEHALETRTPLLVISASGGARMQEGCVSLMQMAKTSAAVARLGEAGILFISFLTDPTYGGVSASYASLGDVLISEPGAHIGFAGPSVIEQTIRQKLPEGFQTSEFLIEHGMLDIVEPRESIRRTMRNLLELHQLAEAARSDGDRAARLPEAEGKPPVSEPDQLSARDPWDVVQLARHIDRPRMLDLVGFGFDDFTELRGDRLFREDRAIIGGLGRLGDLTVMVIGQQKGHTTSEMVEHNFGMPEPEGYRKAMRLMKYAARFGLPLVTIVDTPGAYPGLGAEEHGQSVAIAESIMLMSRLPIPIVTIVTGEGGSGGALALATSDRVLMMENAYYSVISPEGCSTILFKDATAAPRAAKALRITSPELLRLQVMDAVVPEPEGGAQEDPPAAGANFRAALIATLAELLPIETDELLTQRYERFRKFGAPGRQQVLSPSNGET